MTQERHRCHDCKDLSRATESWEMPHIWWWECGSHPGYENLRSFPFESTKCRDFIPRAKPLRPSLFDKSPES